MREKTKCVLCEKEFAQQYGVDMDTCVHCQMIVSNFIKRTGIVTEKREKPDTEDFLRSMLNHE